VRTSWVKTACPIRPLPNCPTERPVKTNVIQLARNRPAKTSREAVSWGSLCFLLQAVLVRLTVAAKTQMHKCSSRDVILHPRRYGDCLMVHRPMVNWPSPVPIASVLAIALFTIGTEASARAPQPLVPTALVEDVTSTTAEVEFMDYVGSGQVIGVRSFLTTPSAWARSRPNCSASIRPKRRTSAPLLPPRP